LVECAARRPLLALQRVADPQVALRYHPGWAKGKKLISEETPVEYLRRLRAD
jgi:hypothetical protein